jgi:hypothetical protein
VQGRFETCPNIQVSHDERVKSAANIPVDGLSAFANQQLKSVCMMHYRDRRRLYRRHGYTDMNPFDMLLPDGTPFLRMWRPVGG